MRSVIISLVILIFILSGVFFYQQKLDFLSENIGSQVSVLEESVKQGAWSSAEEQCQSLVKKCEDAKFTLSCLIEHEEIDNIICTALSAKEYTRYREEPELMSDLSKLKELIEHISIKERISIENIL